MVDVKIQLKEDNALLREDLKKVLEKHGMLHDGTGHDLEENIFEDFYYGDDELNIVEYEPTPQDIIREYHVKENSIKLLMADSIGLGHITDKYLEIIELEKEEARKAIGEDNKEFYNYL